MDSFLKFQETISSLILNDDMAKLLTQNYTPQGLETTILFAVQIT